MYAQFTSLFMAILLQCLGQYYCDGKGSTTAMNKQHACLGYHFRIFVGNSAIFFQIQWCVLLSTVYYGMLFT